MTAADTSAYLTVPGGGVDLTQRVATAPTLGEAMRHLTDHLAAHTAGADAAGLTTVTGTGFATRAATAPIAEAVDGLQYRLGGPCVDVLTDLSPVLYLPDVAHHQRDPASRWHPFAAAAQAHTPVRSLLSFRLHLQPHPPIASLNLYATHPDAFTNDTVTATAQLLAPAVVALAYQVERQTRLDLQTAVHTNRQIAAAVGVIMSRGLVDYGTAFTLLRQASQNTNRKLREIADDVLATGELHHRSGRTGASTADPPADRTR